MAGKGAVAYSCKYCQIGYRQALAVRVVNFTPSGLDSAVHSCSADLQFVFLDHQIIPPLEETVTASAAT